jgi:hypothetical protein
MPLPHNVFMEMSAIIDPENPTDCAGHRTNRSSDHCSDRAGVSFAHRGTFLCASNRALRLCDYWKRQCAEQHYLI